MADTGATSPGTIATSSNGIGSIDWTNPDNAKASDNAYASLKIGHDNTGDG